MQNINAAIKDMYMMQYGISQLNLPTEISNSIKPEMPKVKIPIMSNPQTGSSSLSDVAGNGKYEIGDVVIAIVGIGIMIIVVYNIAESIRQNLEERNNIGKNHLGRRSSVAFH